MLSRFFHIGTAWVHWLRWLTLATVILMVAPASAQEAPSSGILFQYPSTALNGVTSAIVPASEARCRKLCTDRSGCVGFDHSSATQECRLFLNVGSARDASGFVAETRLMVQGYRPPTTPPRPPAPPPPAQPSWFIARYSNVDLFGNDLVPKGLEMSNVESCASYCAGDNSCRAFTFNHAQNRCFLKSGYTFSQKIDDASSGMYFKSLPLNADTQPNLIVEWELFQKSDFPGNDLGEYRAATYQDCLAVCNATSGCGGVTWVSYTTPDHCFLKYGSALVPARPANGKSGVASARKINRVLAPDFVRPVSPRD